MFKNLIKLANHLDSRGLTKEADYLDGIITKLSQSRQPMSEEEAMQIYKNNIKRKYKDALKRAPLYDKWRILDSLNNEDAELMAFFRDDPPQGYEREGLVLEFISKEGAERLVEWLRNPGEWLYDYDYEGIKVDERIKVAAELYIERNHESGLKPHDLLQDHKIEKWMITSFNIKPEEAKLTLDSIKNV